MGTPSTVAVKSALNGLESVLTSGLAHRNNTVTQYKALPQNGDNTARRTIALADLRQQVQTAARGQADAINGLFDELIAAAQAHVAEVAAAATDTPQYRAYVAELTACAPLVNLWSEAAARDQLTNALDETRWPRARALSDLIAARWPMGDREGATIAALLRAEREIPRQEQDDATDFLDYIRKVLRNYRLAAYSLDERIFGNMVGDDVIVTDYRAGFFSPSLLFGQDN